MKNKVLWIDDKPDFGFCQIASIKHDIDIITATCYETGIKELKRLLNEIDAVILDVNCTETKDSSEAPSMNVFRNEWSNVANICDANFIPWFVYTASDYVGSERLDYIIPDNKRRGWDDRQYYHKPKDDTALLINIKKAIEGRQQSIIRGKYKDVFDICPDDFVTPIYELLNAYEENSISDSRIFVQVRTLLEKTMEYMRSHGFCWQTDKNDNESKLNEARKFFSNVSVNSKNTIIPGYISWEFSTCCEITNKGTHNILCKESNVSELIKDGSAPYLIRSTVYGLLTILHWVFSLPADYESIEKRQVDIDNSIREYYKDKKERK